jgi:spore coat polysaccharide biosynthesis protein SpsF
VKVVTIIQARMGSARLPGKVLMDLGGRSVLARVVRRSMRAKSVTKTIVATTLESADDAIAAECQRLGVSCFRGLEDNVLDRYYYAALNHAADVIVRVTSDNPLVDPDLIDDTIETIFRAGADYANNRSPRTYPQGLDVEAFTFAALQKAWHEATRAYEQEHVTPYFYEHPAKFHCTSIKGQFDYSHYRWTLDTHEDLQLIREIYARLENDDQFSWNKALALMESGPQLANINAHIVQKSLH